LIRSLFLTFIFLTGCSFASRDVSFGDKDFNGYKKYTDKDYIAHLNFIGSSYDQSIAALKVLLNLESSEFLKKITTKILSHNEYLFSDSFKPKITILKDSRPFYFSLPNNNIYLSTELFEYIKTEHLLAAILSYEFIKIDKNVYAKKVIVPHGYIQTSQMIDLTLIPLEEKIMLDKWGYYILRRSGYDEDAYLSLIQVQSKNNLDFAFHLGNSSSVLKQEFMFKKFLVESLKKKKEKTIKNSSQSFYAFLQDVKNKSNKEVL